MGTWNVRTLLREGKLANVIAEMKRGNINILGLSETRWQDGGDFNSEGIRVIYAGGKQSQKGVALLLDTETAKSVIQVERHEDRILQVTLKASPVNIKIIQVYMPTSAHGEEEIDAMYDNLEEILSQQKGTDYTILMGDWKAVVGEGREEGYVCKFGLGVGNDRGQKLVDFCRRQKMVITNTWNLHMETTWGFSKIPDRLHNGKRTLQKQCEIITCLPWCRCRY